MRGSDPGEERGDVARGIEQTRQRDEAPADALARREQDDAQDGQPEQEEITDRVDEIGADLDGAPAGGVPDGAERERHEPGGGDQAGHHSVQIVGRGEAPNVALHEHHDPDVGQREESRPQVVGQRRGRRRRAVERLVGEGEVAERPRHAPQAQPQGVLAIRRACQSADEDQHAGQQLETRHAPTIQPRPRLAVRADDQRDRVGDDHERESAEQGLDARTGTAACGVGCRQGVAGAGRP